MIVNESAWQAGGVQHLLQFSCTLQTHCLCSVYSASVNLGVSLVHTLPIGLYVPLLLFYIRLNSAQVCRIEVALLVSPPPSLSATWNAESLNTTRKQLPQYIKFSATATLCHYSKYFYKLFPVHKRPHSSSRCSYSVFAGEMHSVAPSRKAVNTPSAAYSYTPILLQRSDCSGLSKLWACIWVGESMCVFGKIGQVLWPIYSSITKTLILRAPSHAAEADF